MKIGILTFHWAHNYGAVLQAYALQTYLQHQGYDVEIIDYRPDWAGDLKPPSLSWRPGSLLSRLDYLHKKARFQSFCRKFLKISNRQYTYGDTISGYDVVITGSDQVFNPDIIASGGKLDDTYLLCSVEKGTKKVAYAASFGNSTLDSSYADEFRAALSDFSAISIREESGVEIVQQLGVQAVAVPDPTILLGDFQSLTNPDKEQKENYVLSFIFQNTSAACKTRSEIVRMTGMTFRSFINLNQRFRGRRGLLHPSPENWLRAIQSSGFVLTDSFHSTVFSILYYRPFISLCLDAWGGDWSERIKSLLINVGLQNRLLHYPSDEKISNLCSNSIDWCSVNESLAAWRKKGFNFIKAAL